MNELFDEALLLVDEAVQRLLPSRRTFTEKEALGSVWEAGYEVSIQSDARFVLAQEGNWKHPSHWRLASHTLANSRLLNDLLSGNWDGRDLDGKLAALDAEDQKHYVFCPLDPRLTLNKQGILEPTEHERNVALPASMKAALDELGPLLLAYWHDTGAEPWTVRRVTEVLGQLGWRDVGKQNAWLFVRSWLLSFSHVKRVGQDYWVPADQVPREVQRTRLQVLPVRGPTRDNAAEAMSVPFDSVVPRKQVVPPLKTVESQVMLSGEATAPRVTWTVHLRTINLLEGFLHIPAAARGAYPPPAVGEEHTVVLPGVWYEDGTHFWLWLDRTKHQLYGPALAEHLAWLETGDLLRIEWAPDMVVLCLVGHDEEVQGEEARLVDIEALAGLRRGVGESYRRSLQAILMDAPEGLTFAEVVKALRARQNHEVHRGTIHALLYNGGFVHRDRRWFAAPDPDGGVRQLRAALIETPVSREQEQSGSVQPMSRADEIRTWVKAIHTRLSEIITELRET